eukprot:PhF_6_TR31842/c0_g1_i1/m.47154
MDTQRVAAPVSRGQSRRIDKAALEKGMEHLKRRICLSLGVKPQQWATFLLTNTGFMADFVSAPDEVAAGMLYVFMDTAWEVLNLTTSHPTGLPYNHKVMVFYQEDPKNPDPNYSRDFLHVLRLEEIHADIITHATRFYTNIVIPMLPKVNPKWPKVAVKELIYQVRLYVAHLQHYKGTMDNLVTLPVPPLDELKVHGDDETKIDRKDLALLEHHVISWGQYIREALNETSPLEREVDGEYPGLQGEMEFWNLRHRK